MQEEKVLKWPDPAALQQTYQPQVALTLDISVPISTIKGESTDKQKKTCQ